LHREKTAGFEAMLSMRVLFRFLGPHEVIYYDIGTHEIYR